MGKIKKLRLPRKEKKAWKRDTLTNVPYFDQEMYRAIIATKQVMNKYYK